MGVYTPPPRSGNQLPNIYSPEIHANLSKPAVEGEPSSVMRWVKLIAIYLVINLVLYAVQKPRVRRNEAELTKLVAEMQKDKKWIDRATTLLKGSESSLSSAPTPPKTFSMNQPDTYRMQVSAYNFGVDNHNGAVDNFNKRVEKYNAKVDKAKKLAANTKMWLLFPVPIRSNAARNL
jgi:hypothetical protein